jgi:hypothetical protein
MGRLIIPRPGDAAPIPDPDSNNPSDKVEDAKRHFELIGSTGQAFGHLDDALGESVRTLLKAIDKPVPDVQPGTEATRYTIDPGRLGNFANACGPFEKCDDDVGQAVRGLYDVVDRILTPA